MGFKTAADKGMRVTRGTALLARPGVSGGPVLAERMPRLSRPGAGAKLTFGTRVHLARDVGFFLDGDGAQITIGDRCFINRRTEIMAERSVRIGAGTRISWDVTITDTDFTRLTGRRRSSGCRSAKASGSAPG